MPWVRESEGVSDRRGGLRIPCRRTHPGQTLDVDREVAERVQEQGVEVVPAGPHMNEGADMSGVNTHQCGANTMLDGRRSGVQEFGQNYWERKDQWEAEVG